MTTSEATERIKLRNHVRDVYRGLSNRTPLLGFIFQGAAMEPFLEQWMHDLQPLFVVQLAAEVATKMIRRVTDAMAFRVDLHCYPEEVRAQVVGDELKRLLLEPETFSHQEDEFENALECHWHKLNEIAAKHGIDRTSCGPSGEFGRPEKNNKAFVAAAKSLVAPGTELFRVAKAELLQKKDLLSRESDELEALDKKSQRFIKEPEEIAPGEIEEWKAQVNAAADKIESGKATPLPDSDPRIQEQVRTHGVFVVMFVAAGLNDWIKNYLPRKMHKAMETAARRQGASEQFEWPSRGWEEERDQLKKQFADERAEFNRNRETDIEQLRACLDEQLSQQKEQFEQRLREEKSSWKKAERQRRRRQAKNNISGLSDEVVPDRETDEAVPATGSPQDKNLQRRRNEAHRKVLREFATLGPTVVKPVRISSLERLLEAHLHKATRKSQVAQIEGAFRDHIVKLRIREQLKSRYLKDRLLFEDDIRLADFRGRLRRLLRYRLDLEEFQQNADTLHHWLDEFAGKAGHLREQKEQEQELRERLQDIEDQARRDDIPPHLVEARKRFLSRRVKKKVKESTPSHSQDSPS